MKTTLKTLTLFTTGLVVGVVVGRMNPQLMHISCEASSASNYTSAQLKACEALTLWLMSEPLKHLGG